MVKKSLRCEVLLLCCIDFRFAGPIQRLVRKRLRVSKLDLKVDAGAAKMLLHGKPQVRNWILKNVQLARDLHTVRTVVLVHHQDCLAYGGTKAFKDKAAEKRFHQKEMKRAASLIKKKVSGVKVVAFFASCVGGRIRLSRA